METSILISIREKFGGQFFEDPTEASPFDSELIMDINSALMILSQLGVGTSGFVVTGTTETWEEFLGEARTDLELVKSYVFTRVRLMFDNTGMSSTLVGLLQEQIKEYEFRLMARAEHNVQLISFLYKPSRVAREFSIKETGKTGSNPEERHPQTNGSPQGRDDTPANNQSSHERMMVKL